MQVRTQIFIFLVGCAILLVSLFVVGINRGRGQNPPASPTPESISHNVSTPSEPTSFIRSHEEAEVIYQPFERGWLLWHSDLNIFLVLLGDGVAALYPANAIPVMEAAGTAQPIPDNRYEPDPQFTNLLWNIRLGMTVIQSHLGWPTEPAEWYQSMITEQAELGFHMTLPDDSLLILNFTSAWYTDEPAGGRWSISNAAQDATPVWINAVHQDFERGFMVWREDQNCVYAFSYSHDNQPGAIIIPPDAVPAGYPSQYYYCLEVEGLPDNPLTAAPPAGMLIPVGPIGSVWGAYETIRSALGFATDSGVDYQGVMPEPPPAAFGGGPWSVPVMPLRTGSSLWCGVRAATAGSCSIYGRGE